MPQNEKIGVLLVNTGSSSAPETKATRKYLRQFLSDPRVFDANPALRWFILNFIILPFRPKKSAHAYKAIWTEDGSPLLVYSRAFCHALEKRMPHVSAEIAMAYGDPSIDESLTRLLDNGVDRVVVVPMFPQYASATVGSVLEAVYKAAAERMNVPPLSVLPPFYDDPGYLDAWAHVAKSALEEFKPDHILMSFHGLPERHILKSDPTGAHCLKSHTCCENYLQGNPHCYRAHCIVTTKGLVERLGLRENDYTLAFQSRLGRDPWLTPATDVTVVDLAKKGVKRLAILSPAFVVDCLETLEELGIRAKEDFKAHGGKDFLLVPSLNDHPAWVEAMASLLEKL